MISLRSVILGVTVVASVAVTGAMLTRPAEAITCPPGTLRGDKEGSANTLAECNFSEDQTQTNLMTTVQTIINFVLGVLGIVAVVMIILGGFTMITSQGDSAKLNKGKYTILYGVIGLIIALLAFAIVNFVLKGVFNGNGGGTTTDTQKPSIEKVENP